MTLSKLNPLLLLAFAAPGLAQNVLINEVDADTVGTDMLEFIELYDGGVGGTALDGLVVVLYNGATDQSYDAYDLDGFTTDVNGYFLLGNAAVVPTPQITLADNSVQNGADAVALYMDDAANFPVGTAPTVTNILDALVYDTSDVDDAELLILLNAGQPQLNEDGFGTGDLDSNQRCVAGSGGGQNTQYWVQGPPTPAAAPSSIGTNYCTQLPNSTGFVGRMLAYGSTDVLDNDVTLVACDLPQNEFGYFLVSSGMGMVDLVGAGLSNGNLCLAVGADLGRYGNAAQVTMSGPEGMISLVIDLNTIPTATGQPPITQAMAGDTFYFQAWHRDVAGGGPQNNFTDGTSILFN